MRTSAGEDFPESALWTATSAAKHLAPLTMPADAEHGFWHEALVAYASLLAHPTIAVFFLVDAPGVNDAPVIQQDVAEEKDLDSPLVLGQLFDISLTNLDDPGPHH